MNARDEPEIVGGDWGEERCRLWFANVPVRVFACPCYDAWCCTSEMLAVQGDGLRRTQVRGA
jgi:hypothetical protein